MNIGPGTGYYVRSATEEVPGMGNDDKAKNVAEKGLGKAKEGLGKASDDSELEGEGRAEQSKADLKQAGEKAKDAFKK